MAPILTSEFCGKFPKGPICAAKAAKTSSRNATAGFSGRRAQTVVCESSTTPSPISVGDMVPEPGYRKNDPRKQFNAVALAYLGDSVWELYIRRHAMLGYVSVNKIMQSVKTRASAEGQAEYYALLAGGDFLTRMEHDILRWGKNTKKWTVPKRFGPKSVPLLIYRQSTAVECLVGYLYLSNPLRLHALMEHIGLVRTPLET